ncbi:hypothetical protein ABZV91_32300, partial [Nocardia sp. NPDC004568]|uniref:hypothetical protein n=1 Tax=Nocardia sp. NPDC004568 TaxID=3154551 RepID=UPI0033BBB8C4
MSDHLLAEVLARKLADLPFSVDRAEATVEQVMQFQAAADYAVRLFRFRERELAVESWEQRRAVLEHGDTVEAVLRMFAAMTAGIEKTPRWTQALSWLLGQHGFATIQMATAEGKTIVAGLDSMWQLARGAPVELPSGQPMRVHHVVTTTETLANSGLRELQPVIQGLGYEVSRWDPQNPSGDPVRPTVYYMTVGERIDAILYEHIPPGKSATIDEADAALIHDQTEHYLSDGERVKASAAEQAHVERLRDFLKAVLMSQRKEFIADDVVGTRRNLREERLWGKLEALGGRAFTAEEAKWARELTSQMLRQQPERSLAIVSHLWERHTGQAFTVEDRNMAEAFLDYKTGRLKARWDFIAFDGKIQILDQYGKPLSDPKVNTDSRWFGGRHKMLEAIFGFDVYTDGKGSTVATVSDAVATYDRLLLMSGTMERTAAEIQQNFPGAGGLAKVPRYQPPKLVGEPDHVFLTNAERLKAAVERVKELQDLGRPVLVICPSNGVAHQFSLMLHKAGVVEKSMETIAGEWFAQHRDNNKAEEHLLEVKDRAGGQYIHEYTDEETGEKERKVLGRVTVGTPMLGRGFDVSITDEVNDLGGLHALMLGRSLNPDENEQGPARAGRGRNGSYSVYTSVTDELLAQTRHDGAQIAIVHYRTAATAHGEALAEQHHAHTA